MIPVTDRLDLDNVVVLNLSADVDLRLEHVPDLGPVVPSSPYPHDEPRRSATHGSAPWACCQACRPVSAELGARRR